MTVGTLKSVLLQWAAGIGGAYMIAAIAAPIWPDVMFSSPPDLSAWVIASVVAAGALVPLAAWVRERVASTPSGVHPSQGHSQKAQVG